MKVLTPFIMTCFLAATAGAQVHRLNAHLDLGGAMTGGGDFANDGGYTGRFGISVPAGPVAFQLDASGFGHAVTTACDVSTGRHCPPDFPNIAAATVDMVVEMSDPLDKHQFTVVIGGGPFRMSNTQIASNMSFGAEAGTEITLMRHEKNAITLGARIQYVAHTNYGSFWMIPITAGIRFW
jgi:hypothetical protein